MFRKQFKTNKKGGILGLFLFVFVNDVINCGLDAFLKRFGESGGGAGGARKFVCNGAVQKLTQRFRLLLYKFEDSGIKRSCDLYTFRFFFGHTKLLMWIFGFRNCAFYRIFHKMCAVVKNGTACRIPRRKFNSDVHRILNGNEI